MGHPSFCICQLFSHSRRALLCDCRAEPGAFAASFLREGTFVSGADFLLTVSDSFPGDRHFRFGLWSPLAGKEKC